MRLTLLLLFTLQANFTLAQGGCPVDVSGRLVFPAYATPIPHIRVEGLKLDSPCPTGTLEDCERDVYSGPDGEFTFGYIHHAAFDIVVLAEGMQVVRQRLVVPEIPPPCFRDVFIHVDVLLHPVIKTPAIVEDAVAIESLMRKTPGKEVDMFQAAMDNKAKASPAEISTTLQDILKVAPDYYEANLELGLEYKKEDQRENSIRTLTHALELNSGSMLARSALGQYSFEAGDFQKAADLLSEAVRLGNTSANAYFTLGSSYYKLGQLDHAEANLLRVLAIDPSFGNTYLQLYNVYMKGQLPERALAEAKTYLEKFPDAKDRDYVQSIVDKLVSSATPISQPDRPNVLPQNAQSSGTELDGIIRRATEYVEKYETELGNLIGTEEYVQAAIWPNVRAQPTSIDRNPPPGSSPATAAGLPKMVSRRTSSDFMLIEVGPKWVALREVNTVDGAKVPSEQPPLETAFDDSPASNTKRFNSMKADSTKYNIGDILRENNLPTFALQVLRKDQVSRFSFEKDGSEKISGELVWRVKFRELTGPALVSARGGEDLYSTGRLWIEPETGKILKTEFRVENRLAKPRIASNVVVTYARDNIRNILVPNAMTEHYETADNIIDCRAVYSHFHPYTVDVKFEPVAPKPQR